MAASSKMNAALAAMAAFEVNPTPETLDAVQRATAPVMAALVKADEWTGDEESGVLGWPDRNKAAINRIKREHLEAEAAVRVADAEAKAAQEKEDIVKMRVAIAEERRKQRAEAERRLAARRPRMTRH